MIITISREFGSGGRELGKRLADELGYAYYDSEIVTAVARNSELDEHYVERTLEGGFSANFTFNFGKTLSYSPSIINQDTMQLFVTQHKIIKDFAKKGNCVIVGRAADAILSGYSPFNIFVYADIESRIKRCAERAAEDEDVSVKELTKKIKRIDNQRKRYYSIFGNNDWGDKTGYHLCINTTGVNIKDIVPAVAQYIKLYSK